MGLAHPGLADSIQAFMFGFLHARSWFEREVIWLPA
jgi:hypothetical protein